MRGSSLSGVIAAIFLLSACNGGLPDGQPSASGALAAPTDTRAGEPAFPQQVYWGDTHLHTLNSGDAILNGVRLSPEDALRFATGQKVTASSGVPAQLERPLDFLVVADHSEGLGTVRELLDGNTAYIADPVLKRWYDMSRGTAEDARKAAVELISAFAQGRLPKIMSDASVSDPIIESTWQGEMAAVERYNQPGKFTAFIGYEWTSTPKGDNLHRIVIFRDGRDLVSKVRPFTSLDGQNPEQLWSFLANYETVTGGRVLAIPHNGDLSNGLMFALTDFEGRPINADYARRRARWEPLTEVTQGKGDSESHPLLSPDDPFADFGHAGWDIGNLDLSRAKTNDMLAGEYAREALKRGLLVERRTGVNPFKFGMIGATDSHTSLSTAGERNFFGETTGSEPGPERASRVQVRNGLTRVGWEYLSGGYTAVWARSNTRAALFDAMQRREVYGTTGTRLTLRVFGGWDFSPRDLTSDYVRAGYGRGVPMGGDLAGHRGRGAPSFMIAATKDPLGANLDRLQVVKGWVDAGGEAHEKVYNVAWSDTDRRRLDGAGRLPPVGDTVDLARATYANTIGAAQLRTVWRDPDFDPRVKAFYYVKVLEIPTPRWPAYDAVRLGAKLPADARLKDQQRGYSSPIWYEPTA